ncbi:dihydroorotate dehydrogenase-like protein [Anabaenopsis elenkinii]|jgi:dihydroorotate dehydrogenase (fumarate)|uniref:Dihydroorotate dehydrogenase-like protein n=1 Tax=Anabaenopsis elenkinii CCIBt3563 TaxID=2779889 RepID=A0A7S6U300_9CYAN|nr:dihydroorotate dehydrogenase-like protein [Anabaenopsis elenkinii]QOV23695.1 dihydroorotate dehydrogenase-like protein [Anabaenopsis elenkinii CCIBt3563]
MDLTTTYMGIKLRSPLVPSASPLSEDIDNIQRMETAGAGAVVMHSLFEEQLRFESHELHHHLTQGTESFSEALTYLPDSINFRVGPETYLEHIHKAKERVSIPIIASLNGSSLGGWTNYAKQIQQAGADALELNIYYVPTDMELTSNEIEQTYINILDAVKAVVTIPVAVKLSPYFTNMANMAKRLDAAGADALVLFNRFYQADINLSLLDVEPNVLLSTPQSLRLPLRWIAILHGRIHADLAATSGIHRGEDVLKMLMAGARITMLCSVLLKHGIDHIRVIEREMREWMEKHEYESVQQMQGSMSQKNCPNPSAFERVQYMRSLAIYKPEWKANHDTSYYFG